MDQGSSLLKLSSLYELISTSEKVYGPYLRPSDGRQIVIIKEDNGTSRTVSYPKYIMEKHLGRPLNPSTETVDHLNFNIDDNRIENLRIVPRDQHSADDTRRVKLIKFHCSMCGKEFERSPRLVRDKSKKGKRGIFCGRQCAGRYARQLQLKKIKKLPIQPFIQSEYYRRKNVQAFCNYIIIKYNF